MVLWGQHLTLLELHTSALHHNRDCRRLSKKNDKDKTGKRVRGQKNLQWGMGGKSRPLEVRKTKRLDEKNGAWGCSAGRGRKKQKPTALGNRDKSRRKKNEVEAGGQKWGTKKGDHVPTKTNRRVWPRHRVKKE